MSQSDSINNYLAHLLAQANRLLSRQLGEEGVPVDQWRILRVLHDQDGMTMRNLADAVSLNGPTMTKIVDKLVAEALAYRVPDPKDRRKVRIFLSEQGRALYRQHNGRVNQHQDSVSNSYGVENTRQLREMLESFLSRVSVPPEN